MRRINDERVGPIGTGLARQNSSPDLLRIGAGAAILVVLDADPLADIHYTQQILRHGDESVIAATNVGAASRREWTSCHTEHSRRDAERKLGGSTRSEMMVGRGRFELPTNGLKVRCSTD